MKHEVPVSCGETMIHHKTPQTRKPRTTSLQQQPVWSKLCNQRGGSNKMSLGTDDVKIIFGNHAILYVFFKCCVIV